MSDLNVALRVEIKNVTDYITRRYGTRHEPPLAGHRTPTLANRQRTIRAVRGTTQPTSWDAGGVSCLRGGWAGTG